MRLARCSWACKNCKTACLFSCETLFSSCAVGGGSVVFSTFLGSVLLGVGVVVCSPINVCKSENNPNGCKTSPPRRQIAKISTLCKKIPRKNAVKGVFLIAFALHFDI